MTPADFVQSVPVPQVYIRRDARIGALNAPASRLLGDGLVGRHYITALRQPAVLEAIEAAQSRTPGEAPTTARYLGQEAGRELVFLATITRLPGEDGLLVTFEDITPHEEAGQMRSDFVANVSHELRTPLTALSGFIETLRGPARDDPEARDRFLDIMEREAARMNRLVQDLLSLSRVEDVERMRPTDHVDVARIVTSVAMGLEPLAEGRGGRLRTVGCDTAIDLQGDADQLTQVFTNLIENAIKYGAEGGTVTITLTRHDNLAALRGPGVTIEVADEGEGISLHHLARLTERFYRVDSHRSRGVGGTGLGLAIVKHIVNRHRGRLRITSEPGQGSRFTVSLPLGPARLS